MDTILRPGNTNDSAWIVNLLKEGVRDGHYGPAMKFQATEFIQSIFERGGVHMIKMRGGIQAPTFVHASISIAEEAGSPAAFLVCCTDESGAEIHLAGTEKKFRGKGHFNALVKDLIKNNQESKIYARCYAKSSWAISALKKLNFEITKDGNPIELTLSR